MTRQPHRLGDLLPEVAADLARRHQHTNGEPPPMKPAELLLRAADLEAELRALFTSDEQDPR